MNLHNATYIYNKLIRKLIIFSGVISIVVFSLNCRALSMTSDRENEIKTRIHRIITSKEFGVTAEGKARKTLSQIISEALRNFWNWLTGKLGKQIGRIKLPKSGSRTGDTIGSILLFVLEVLCFVLIIAILTAIVFFIFRALKNSKRIKEKKDSILLSSLKDPQTMERKALEYADKGDFRLAVRFLYISMLLKLNEANIIKIDKSKTNKQYLTEIRSNNSIKYDMACQFTEEFNQSWYGNRGVKKEKFDYWHKNYIQLIGGK